jgi:hypothetical protein
MSLRFIRSLCISCIRRPYIAHPTGLLNSAVSRFQILTRNMTVFNASRLLGKTVLITGASSGIGAVCTNLALRRATPILIRSPHRPPPSCLPRYSTMACHISNHSYLVGRFQRYTYRSTSGCTTKSCRSMYGCPQRSRPATWRQICHYTNRRF